MIRIVWTPRGYTISAPAFVAGRFQWGFLVYSRYRVLVAVPRPSLLLALTWWFLEKTPYGAIMKAGAARRRDGAGAEIDLARLRNLVFSLGTFMAGIAGVDRGAHGDLKPTVGAEAVMPAFIVVVIGGIGSFWGAIVGGLILGPSAGSPTWWCRGARSWSCTF